MVLTAIQTAAVLLDTIWRILQVALFSLVRIAYVSVQRMLWRFNGTLQKVEESAHPENYERSVQILDILFYHSYDWSFPADIHSQFILAHNRFESPSYILDNDHVTLMTLTETHAVFAEARDKDAHLWKTQYGAFFRLAQVRHCNKLLFAPLEALHRLSETVGDPDGRLIFLHSTGRCGSTLVVQMLNATDRIVAISEPDACNVLWFWQLEKKQPVVPIDQLRKDVIRLVCRPYRTISSLVYLVKFPSYHARHMSLYQELFPKSRHLFMYRNMMPAIQSQYRMMMGMVTARTQLATMPLLPDRLNKYIWFSFRFVEERFFCEENHTDMRLLGLEMLVETIVYYLESRQKGLDIEAIRYEDIVADPMYACNRLLEFCGAPENLSELALQGMRSDSQRSSPIAKTAIENYRCPAFDPEFRQSANRLLRKYGLPNIEEELLLEGTITSEEKLKLRIFNSK